MARARTSATVTMGPVWRQRTGLPRPDRNGCRWRADRLRRVAGTLFGRDDELAWLRAVADPRAPTPPRLVVVEGEAGIGKTTLVRALAAGTSARVRWAQGGEDGAPPFWVW